MIVYGKMGGCIFKKAGQMITAAFSKASDWFSQFALVAF